MARRRKTRAEKQLNRKLWLFFGSLGVSLVAAAAFVFLLLRPIPVDSISFSQEEICLRAGESLPLTYSWLPDEATETEVVFKSSNRAVASVQNGVLTAISEGSCYISITAESGAKDTLFVKVEAPLVEQEKAIVGLWRIVGKLRDNKIDYIYNDDSSLTLAEDRQGVLIYGKKEYRFPDWRYKATQNGHDYFEVKDESQQTLDLYLITDRSSGFMNCLRLYLPDGECLLFKLEKEPE